MRTAVTKVKIAGFGIPITLIVIHFLISSPPLLTRAADSQTKSALAEQIHSDVLHSLQLTKDAHSHLTLVTSGYSAQDVLNNVEALQSTEAWNALCDSLLELSSTDLAIFDAAITNPRKPYPELTCKVSLEEKLRRYWKEAGLRLQTHLLKRFGRTVASFHLTPQTKLPSLEIGIHTESTPYVSGQLGQGLLQEKQIALTFDGGPSPERTLRLLAVLKDAGVRAQFFQEGDLIRAHSELTRKIFLAGHVVSTRGMTHSPLSKMDLSNAFAELQHGLEEVETSTGHESSFVRLPLGASSPSINAFLKEHKVTVIGANMDSQDWKTTDPSELFDHVLGELDREQGGILELNENSEASLIALPYVLKELKARGFSTVVFAKR